MYSKKHQSRKMNFMFKEVTLLSIILFMTSVATFAFAATPSLFDNVGNDEPMTTISEETEQPIGADIFEEGLSLDVLTKETYSDTQVVTCGKLNVREDASLEAEIVGKYIEGTQFKYTESETDDNDLTWVKSPKGWVCEDYITTAFKSELESDTDVYVPPVPVHLSGGVLCTEITKPSGLSIDEINKLIEGTVFKDCGETILECEKKYNVNAFFLLAVTNQEAGPRGCSNRRLNIDKHNIFGLMGMSFKNYDDCIEYFCKNMRNNYFDQGRTTVDSVSKKYCKPPQHWATCVKSMMNAKYRSVKR